jgi:hypothetical protein
MNLQSKYQIYIMLITILLALSCEIAADWNIQGNNEEFIVVYGIITNEKKAHEIAVSKSVSTINEKSRPVSGANVLIYDGDSLHQLTENPLNQGIYNTDQGFRAFINKTYNLIVTTEGKQYFANASMVPVTPFRALRYKYDEKKELFFIDSVTQTFNQQDAAMYEIVIDWSELEAYASVPKANRKARLFYYSLNTIDISQVFEPEKEKVYFPSGTLITQRKYSLSPIHALFIRSLLLETQWRGGLFDVSQGNVFTNLSNGAKGFFGASTVVEHSFIVN